MKELLTIGVISIITCCTQTEQTNETDVEEIVLSDLFGEYVYYKEEHFPSENDSVVFNNMLRIEIVLHDDSTYTENNENFECFSNLPDYSGTFSVVDSTLICCRRVLGIHHVDRTKEGLPTIVTEGKIVPMTYRLRNNSLISMSDSSIILLKKI